MKHKRRSQALVFVRCEEHNCKRPAVATGVFVDWWVGRDPPRSLICDRCLTIRLTHRGERGLEALMLLKQTLKRLWGS
jgi:hypothetical protein